MNADMILPREFFWRPTLKRFRVPLKRSGVDIRQVQS